MQISGVGATLELLNVMFRNSVGPTLKNMQPFVQYTFIYLLFVNIIQ
jgi:hypothetical protein